MIDRVFSDRDGGMTRAAAGRYFRVGYPATAYRPAVEVGPPAAANRPATACRLAVAVGQLAAAVGWPVIAGRYAAAGCLVGVP